MPTDPKPPVGEVHSAYCYCEQDPDFPPVNVDPRCLALRKRVEEWAGNAVTEAVETTRRILKVDEDFR